MAGTMETFVVRVWRPDGADVGAEASSPLRGIVERLVTGERHPFRNGAELVVYLTGEAEREGRHGLEPRL